MIGVLIPDQGFEKIRDRILCILAKEYENQANRYSNKYCLHTKFFADRTAPIQENETTLIIISLWKGDYSNKSEDYVDGTYSFVIDIIQSAKAKGNERGDTRAGYKLQKHIGMVRYILEHSMYRMLEFDAPFILHTELSKFQVLRFDKEELQDSENATQAQAVFTVRCGEVTHPADGDLVAGSDTEVELEETELGYEYSVTYENG